ncbi:MIR motif-containing protein [Mycena olivaceomarginata]|nr:MIR motif-containing protein [Mycena olivaceomarginata]
MPRFGLNSLYLVLVPGIVFPGLYNLQSAKETFKDRLHAQMHAQADSLNVDAIYFRSTVTLRHISSTGGYLHSHPLFYPAGSKQQQVTVSPQRSEETMWRIYNATIRDETRPDPQALAQPVVSGSTVMLRHVPTSKHLHSHADISPPVSMDGNFQEVTGYGMLGFAGDANDDWIVEPTQGGVLATASPFRLRHKITGCHLSSYGAFLPEWGLGLQEVLCSRQEFGDDLWIIDAI